MPCIPVAIGELIDKITILQIKAAHLEDASRYANVATELRLLEEVRAGLKITNEDVDAFTTELRNVNEELWELEDRIRECERLKDFGPTFIELARGIYTKNDRRAELKRSINNLTASELVEEKSYIQG